MNLYIAIACILVIVLFEKFKISRFLTFYIVSVLVLTIIGIPKTFLVIYANIGLLILLITLFKVNAFLSFLVVSILTGILLGLKLSEITPNIQKGIGDMLGGLIIVVACGAMLGKLTADSGAAQRIASGLMNLFGRKYIQWALVVTGFIIGIPLFYNVGFVLVIPLIFSVAYKYKMPLLYIGLPMLASLSVTHGFLPPHPSPTALVAQFNAEMGKTLLWGVLIGIPTVALAGPLFSRTLKRINPVIPDTFVADSKPENELPGLANSVFSSLMPVILLSVTTILNNVVVDDSPLKSFLIFISDPAIVMIVSLAMATFTLGLGMNFSMTKVMSMYGEAIKDIAMLLLIIGGAGTLKQILVATGVSGEIGGAMNQVDIHPLILGWLIACVIRVCVGSATVAGLTAASIVAPLVNQPGVDPNLMVLSVGAGSLMFSHVNDSGFWMYKEYFNLSIKETILSWSLMETIIAIAGLAGVLTIHYLRLLF
jgi:Gnt-I system high-affinity gluconate transporter